MPKRNIIMAAPEPLPVPKSRVSQGMPLAMMGSQHSSTSSPPRKKPMGMVKNCRVFRQA